MESVAPPAGRVIYQINVDNLPPETTWQQLKDFVRLSNGRSIEVGHVGVNPDMRCGMVRLPDEASLLRAYNFLTSTKFDYHRLNVRATGIEQARTCHPGPQVHPRSQIYPTAPYSGYAQVPVPTPPNSCAQAMPQNVATAPPVGHARVLAPMLPYSNNKCPGIISPNAAAGPTIVCTQISVSAPPYAKSQYPGILPQNTAANPLSKYAGKPVPVSSHFNSQPPNAVTAPLTPPYFNNQHPGTAPPNAVPVTSITHVRVTGPTLANSDSKYSRVVSPSDVLVPFTPPYFNNLHVRKTAPNVGPVSTIGCAQAPLPTPPYPNNQHSREMLSNTPTPPAGYSQAPPPIPSYFSNQYSGTISPIASPNSPVQAPISTLNIRNRHPETIQPSATPNPDSACFNPVTALQINYTNMLSVSTGGSNDISLSSLEMAPALNSNDFSNPLLEPVFLAQCQGIHIKWFPCWITENIVTSMVVSTLCIKNDEILSVSIATAVNVKNKSYAVVTFKSKDMAEFAVRVLDGISYHNECLQVKLDHDRQTIYPLPILSQDDPGGFTRPTFEVTASSSSPAPCLTLPIVVDGSKDRFLNPPPVYGRQGHPIDCSCGRGVTQRRPHRVGDSRDSRGNESHTVETSKGATKKQPYREDGGSRIPQKVEKNAGELSSRWAVGKRSPKKGGGSAVLEKDLENAEKAWRSNCIVKKNAHGGNGGEEVVPRAGNDKRRK